MNMKRLFGDLKMTWIKVILFAVFAGVYTGAINSVPLLKDTSFQDIAISYEWWVVFAVIVVVNCKKGWEAMLKCFVFFLISQPLVYLTEIALGALAPEMGWYYYRAIWGPATLLTIPGGFIAYYCKKQNILGAVILGLGNTIQALLALSYFGMAFKAFPHHLLSAIFCVISIFVMTLCIHKEKRNRLISLLLPIVLTLVILVLLTLDGRTIFI